MTNTVVKIKYNDPYPKEFTDRSQAHFTWTAIARAVKNWKKETKRSRIKRFVIEVDIL